MENDNDYFDEEESAYHDCPKCNLSYDDIDYEFQICRRCGWDADNKTWGERREPSDGDYLSGEADILTGRWY